MKSIKISLILFPRFELIKRKTNKIKNLISRINSWARVSFVPWHKNCPFPHDDCVFDRQRFCMFQRVFLFKPFKNHKTAVHRCQCCGFNSRAQQQHKKNEMRLMPKQKRELKIHSHQKFMNIKIQRQRHSDTQTQTKKMSIIKVLPFGFRSSHEPSM